MLIQDLRYALRQLRKSPGFTLTVVIMLSLGIGANAAVFSVVDAAMLRPLPYAQSGRLVEVQSFQEGSAMGSNVSYPDFFDWRVRNRSFSHLVSYHDTSLTLTGVERAVHLDGEIVSWDLLPMLGVRPELGRGFTSDEEKKGTRAVLISHSLWQSQFGGDKSVMGRALNLSGEQFTVIGVMPASFQFPVSAEHNSFWTTLAVEDENLSNRGAHFFSAMGRLKDGVTVEQANQDMKSIAAQLAKAYPDTNTRHSSARVLPEIEALLGDTRALLLLVLSAVALVLLIACGNIANLQLARVRERQREIAVRAAIGAGRVRVIGQLMVESLVLSLLGGLAGCGLAYAAVPAMLKLIGDQVPRAADAGVDPGVLGFALLISVACALVFGLAPAFTASRTDLIATLQQNSQSSVSSRDWVRKAVTVAQVALGIVLTVAAGLLISSYYALTHTDEGFNPSHLLTYNFETPDAAYKTTRAEFYRRYFDRLRALPGVQAAAGAMILPMTYDLAHISFENPEQPVAKGRRPGAEFTPVSTDFFRTLQIPLVKGRDFTDADTTDSAQVMIINQAFAQKYFPGEDPIGKKLKPGAGNGTPGGPPWRQIVGVVGNVRHEAMQREMDAAMYAPASQLPTWCCLRTVVRTAVDPLSFEPAARRLVQSMDSNIPVTDVRTMDELLSIELTEPRFTVILLGSFAALALILTIVGLYGVMAYSVARRTREIGLRMALGARRGTVLTMILRDASLLLAIGIAIGVAAAIGAGPILSAMLYGTGPRNPFILATVTLGVALAGLLAAYVPALRAAKIEPMEALRSE